MDTYSNAKKNLVNSYTKINLLMVIVLLANIIVFPINTFAAITLPFSDTYSGYDDNTLPKSFTHNQLNAFGEITYVAGQYGKSGSDKAMKIAPCGISGNTNPNLNLASVDNALGSNNMIIEVNVSFQDYKIEKQLLIKPNSTWTNTYGTYCSFKSDGYIYSGTSAKTAMRYELNKWYHVVGVFYGGKNTYDLYVNNNKLIDGGTLLTGSTLSSVGLFRYNVNGQGATSWMVDDLKINTSASTYDAVNANTVAQVVSTQYEVDNYNDKIQVPTGTTVSQLKNGLTCVGTAAKFEVFSADYSTIAADMIVPGLKVVVTAADGATVRSYSINENPSYANGFLTDFNSDSLSNQDEDKNYSTLSGWVFKNYYGANNTAGVSYISLESGIGGKEQTDKSLKIYTDNKTGDLAEQINERSSFSPTVGTQVLEVSVLLNDMNVSRQLAAKGNGLYFKKNMLEFNTDGTVSCFGRIIGNGFKYNINKWYNCAVVLYQGTLKYELYIDGIKRMAGTDLPLAGNPVTSFQSLNYINFYQSVPSSAKGTTYIDDIKLYNGLYSGIKDVVATITITSPYNNQRYYVGDKVSICGVLSAINSNTIECVQIRDGNKVLGNALFGQGTFTYDFINATEGTHSFTAVATDSEGNVEVSNIISVSVVKNSAPTVNITYPYANAQYNVGETIKIRSNVEDLDSNLNKVIFYDGYTKIGEICSAPYEMDYKLSEGQHTIIAKAIDICGESATSAVTISAVNGGELIVVSDDFSDYTNGIPTDFSASSANNATLIPDGGKIKMSTNTYGNNPFLGANLTELSGMVGAEAEITIEKTSHKRELFTMRQAVKTASGSYTALFATPMVIVNGVLYLNTSDAIQPVIETLSPGVPYTIKQVYDTRTHFVDVYINGVKKISQQKFNCPDLSLVQQVRICHVFAGSGSGTTGGTDSTWIDNFKIFSHEQPSNTLQPDICYMSIYDSNNIKLNNISPVPNKYFELRFKFNNDINVSTLNEENIQFYKGENLIKYIGEYDAVTRIYTIHSLEPIEAGAECLVIFDKSISDRSGRSMADDKTYTFTMQAYDLAVSNVSFKYKDEANQAVILENGKTLQVSAAISNSESNVNAAAVTVCLYKNGKLYNIKSNLISVAKAESKTTDILEIPLPDDVSDYSVKFYAWNNYIDMEPIPFTSPIITRSVLAKAPVIDNKFFPGWSRKALTFSYDDGCAQDDKLVGIFRQNGIKSTFNLISHSLIGTQGELQMRYDGFEVASHSYTHKTWDQVTDSWAEIIKGRSILENTFGYPIRGFVYPYSKPDDESVWQEVSNSGAVYARTSENTNGFDLPTDFLNWNPTCHHNSLSTIAPTFLNLPDDGNMKLLYVWGHSSEFDRDNLWNMIEDFAASVKDRTDIWKATNIDIYNYIMAQKNLVIADTYIYNPSSTDVYIKVDGNEVKVLSGQTIRY